MDQVRTITTLTDYGAEADYCAIEGFFQTLSEAVLAGVAQGVLIEIVSEVEDFWVNHFANEEQIFRANLYPGLKKHAFAHRKILKELRAAHAALDTGEVEAIVDVSDLLTVFHNHVTHVDQPAHIQMQRQHNKRRGLTCSAGSCGA